MVKSGFRHHAVPGIVRGMFQGLLEKHTTNLKIEFAVGGKTLGRLNGKVDAVDSIGNGQTMI